MCIGALQRYCESRWRTRRESSMNSDVKRKSASLSYADKIWTAKSYVLCNIIILITINCVV